ncbi:MAG: DUF1326 domain-containing protein [Gammaproteobacteria bacterium]
MSNMKRRDFNHFLGLAAAASTVLGASTASAGGAWSFTADIAECCSCEIPCPCNFGRPTKLRCDGSRLIQIRDGHAGKQDLAGISFVATFEMREWAKIYVDETLNEKQMAALESIMPLAFKGFHKLKKSMITVPLTVSRSAETVSFETPEIEVKMKLLKGMDGKAIKISGLPSPAFYDYTQYESVAHRHKGGDREWSHSGTNGFTSRMVVSG